jgi:dephospho-CoA kinase
MPGFMHLFGLTGGIASGKSTVARRFASRGVPVIDADAVARGVVLPGTEGLAEIRATFGDAVFLADGTLDRRALAAVVFSDEGKRRRLNAILHPRIGARTAERAAELAAKGEALVCYEAALLVENGLVEAFRPLVVVAAPSEMQVERAVARDGGTPADALARIAAQTSLADKTKIADFVITNDADLGALERAADDVLDRVCERVGVARPSRGKGAG